MQKQKGIIIPLTTIALLGIFAVIGLALDTGLLFNDYRKAQTAADAAALSGAFEKYNERDEYVIASSQSAAAENGYQTSNQDNINVTVNHPPLTGFYQGNDNSVEVIITKQNPTFLLQVIGINDIGYTVRAVANGSQASIANCIYVLGETNHKEAFLVGSGSSLIANCGIYVNSPNDEAAYVESGSTVEASDFSVAGEMHKDDDSTVECTNGDCPIENAPTISDPFESMTLPKGVHDETCPKNGENKCKNGICIGKYKDEDGYEPYKIESGNVTLNPGTYCGGLQIKAANVTLNPGTYVMRGGGLVVDDSKANLTGDGVTIYNTCYEDCSGTNSDNEDQTHWFGPIEVNSGTIDLSATDCSSNSGCDSNLDGMLLVADPESPASSQPMKEPINKIDSGATAILTGAIYVGHQHLKYHSNSTGNRTQG